MMDNFGPTPSKGKVRSRRTRLRPVYPRNFRVALARFLKRSERLPYGPPKPRRYLRPVRQCALVVQVEDPDEFPVGWHPHRGQDVVSYLVCCADPTRSCVDSHRSVNHTPFGLPCFYLAPPPPYTHLPSCPRRVMTCTRCPCNSVAHLLIVPCDPLTGCCCRCCCCCWRHALQVEGVGRHADSLGNRGEYSAPGMQWMSTGSGVEHAEGGGTPAGMNTLGFQIWINVPSARKSDAPRCVPHTGVGMGYLGARFTCAHVCACESV
jgi:hypothetical protein